MIGYKINIHKSIAFLYTNNKLSKRELLKNHSVYNCFKINKMPGINLNKEVKDLYSANCKILTKETKEYTNKLER